MISRRDDLNQAFYGPGATPQAIVLQHRFSNPQADGLRAALRVE
jgi:lipid-binding SYLF domain-containing protein